MRVWVWTQASVPTPWVSDPRLLFWLALSRHPIPIPSSSAEPRGLPSLGSQFVVQSLCYCVAWTCYLIHIRRVGTRWSLKVPSEPNYPVIPSLGFPWHMAFLWNLSTVTFSPTLRTWQLQPWWFFIRALPGLSGVASMLQFPSFCFLLGYLWGFFIMIFILPAVLCCLFSESSVCFRSRPLSLSCRFIEFFFFWSFLCS